MAQPAALPEAPPEAAPPEAARPDADADEAEDDEAEDDAEEAGAAAVAGEEAEEAEEADAGDEDAPDAQPVTAATTAPAASAPPSRRNIGPEDPITITNHPFPGNCQPSAPAGREAHVPRGLPTPYDAGRPGTVGPRLPARTKGR